MGVVVILVVEAQMAATKKPFIKPYRTGDVCRYRGKDRFWKGEHIIHEAELRALNRYEYCTTQGAWIPHRDLVLIRECDEASMQQLLSDLEEEF